MGWYQVLSYNKGGVDRSGGLRVWADAEEDNKFEVWSP